MRLSTLAIGAVAVTALAYSATDANARVRHMNYDGTKYCITYLGMEERSGYYYASWKNECDFTIYINYTRVKVEDGSVVNSSVRVSGNSTATENMYFSSRFDWDEAP